MDPTGRLRYRHDAGEGDLDQRPGEADGRRGHVGGEVPEETGRSQAARPDFTEIGRIEETQTPTLREEGRDSQANRADSKVVVDLIFSPQGKRCRDSRSI